MLKIRAIADFYMNKILLSINPEHVKNILNGTRTGIQIDITTGDKITPSEIRYSYYLLLENRSIDIA